MLPSKRYRVPLLATVSVLLTLALTTQAAGRTTVPTESTPTTSILANSTPTTSIQPSPAPKQTGAATYQTVNNTAVLQVGFTERAVPIGSEARTDPDGCVWTIYENDDLLWPIYLGDASTNKIFVAIAYAFHPKNLENDA